METIKRLPHEPKLLVRGEREDRGTSIAAGSRIGGWPILLKGQQDRDSKIKNSMWHQTHRYKHHITEMKISPGPTLVHLIGRFLFLRIMTTVNYLIGRLIKLYHVPGKIQK